MKSPLRVAVVGGGTTGPAVALFLKRAGHEVNLFEKVPQLVPVGAGLLVQPTGMEVLHRLGLLQDVLRHGAKVSRLHSETRYKKTFLHLNYSELSPGGYGLGIHRAVLCHYLFEALKREKIPLSLGAAITQFHHQSAEVWLSEEKEKRHGPFDLLILADGARSVLRDQTGLVKRSTRYPWGALWFIGQDPHTYFPDTLFQVLSGTKKMLGFLPTGLDVDRKVPLVSLFWSLHEGEQRRVREKSLKDWKREVLDLYPAADFLLDQIERWDQLTYAAYYDVVMKEWHRDKVVVLGDAGHAMSPQLGQGVNLGFYDAMVLTDALRDASTLSEALRNYSRQRRSHLKFYQFATRWATPFFQSSAPGLGLLRDYGFALLNKIPVLRRQMTRSMAGLKRGFVRRSLGYFKVPSGEEEGR